MTTRKARVSRPVNGLVRHPGLYRAQLSCKLGREALEGQTMPPDGVSPMEWAMFNLLHAVEEIATAMMPNACGQIPPASGGKVPPVVGH